MIYVLLIFLGLCLGSFVNALIWRLHEQSEFYDDEGKQKKLTKADRKRLEKLSISKGRSMCAKCGHRLSVLDLIPVVSWLTLKGRCRYCKERIDDNPVIEVVLPVVLVITYVFWPLSISTGSDYALFGIWVLMMTCFVALAAYDFKWYLLPDKIVVPLTILSLIFVLFRSYISDDPTSIYQALAGGIVLAGFFLLLHVVSKGAWIGFGDVKLAVSLGLIAGSPLMAALIMFVASLSGTLSALPQLVSAKRMVKRAIPFGPHLLLGTLIVFMFGQALVDWYLNLLLP